MLRFEIDKDVNWFMFCEESYPFSAHVCDLVHPILAVVKRLFTDTFGTDYVNSFNPLYIMPTHGYPMTFKENNIVFLSSSASIFQTIYQFSHELCHIMIKSKVATDFQWLEETICEMASIYCFERMENYIQNGEQIPSVLRVDSVQYKNYIDTTLRTATPLNGMPLSKFIELHLHELKNDPYLRHYNAAIALSVYPIFKNNIAAWASLIRMGKVTSGSSLREALNIIFNDSASEPALHQLTNLLCD